MTDIMVETSEYHGSLVAFEGPEDIISTQLRLLPNSSKILILPSFQYFVGERNGSSPFDARLLIIRTHEACHVRTEMARTFLRESAPDNKRLVFMDGGTVSARMSCISAISRHETNGDIIKAEKIFNELIQNGIASLMRQSKPKPGSGIASRLDTTTDMDGKADDFPDDPISKAMRAADALYLETSFLQDTDEIDFTVEARPRSISVPALPVADELQNAAPFYVFGPTENSENTEIMENSEKAHLPLYVEKWRAMTAAEDQLTETNTVTRPPSCVSEVYPYDPFRPTSAVGPPRTTVESMPTSPVLLGSARLVNIRSPMPSAQKRIKSVDRIYATAIRNQDISLCILPQSTMGKPEEPAQNSTQEKESDSPKKPILRSNFYSETSYPTFVKPNRTIMRKGLPPPLTLDIEGARQSSPCVSQIIDPESNYVHESTLTEPVPSVLETGTGNSDTFLNIGDDFEPDTQEPFQAVLPMVEDLVIHFKGDKSEPALEVMIQALKSGAGEISMPTLLTELEADMSQSATSTTRSAARKLAENDIVYSRQATQESTPVYSPGDYDPFASHGNYLGHRTTGSLPKQDTGNWPREIVVVSTPPTPAQTPPPRTNTLPGKLFHDFDIKECKTAICIQNSLRSILNVYFPPENIGYHQFNFPLLPELSSFWRPVFREMPSDHSNATRKIDLILAIGAQKGAGRGLLGAINGSLEELGREPNGASRSGRLDLRYLIANAMQAFTSQPLANQTQDNPFSNPLLLATLIIPHLETYIAAHSTTRFLLLEYPAEYLSTVLSLQHLIGVDLLKVAGIIDAESSDPKSYRAYRKQSLHTVASSPTSSASIGASAMLLPPKGPKPKLDAGEKTCPPQPSFSKANFILTSTAPETEIATFISTIWRILIEISDSYIPKTVTVANWKSNTTDYPLSSSSLIHPKEQYAPLFRAAVMLGFAPPPEDEQQQQSQHRGARTNYVSSGTYADLPPPTKRPVTPVKSSKASIAETFRSSATRTPRTPRTVHDQRSKLRHILGNEFNAAGSSETGEFYDLEGEEDEIFSAEERKYMPLWSQQGGPRKGNSSKALKWLGLAN
ncbi:hypothetical protein E0Z10_g10325 [Xylaria hypoxylon]|uniref:Gastric mucin-like protein n=1 Tax=Xylaria hypoxylon TaxID=37992 RepID=A0A4Z0YI72_9PEZI|nr:hypothetical protein E0Z10_g10325 [Xylaria hypoxylon]